MGKEREVEKQNEKEETGIKTKKSKEIKIKSKYKKKERNISSKKQPKKIYIERQINRQQQILRQKYKQIETDRNKNKYVDRYIRASISSLIFVFFYAKPVTSSILLS